MSFYTENASLFIGSWLRRISETYLHEVSRIYQSLNIPFEPSWFPIFFILNKQHQVSITELASVLGVSQPAISQMISHLQKKNFITITANEIDARKKDIILSNEGRVLLESLRPVWISMDQAIKHIFKQNPLTSELIEGLIVLEKETNNGKIHDMTLSIYNSRAFDIFNLRENGQVDLYDYFLEKEGVFFTYPSVEADVLVAKIKDEIIGAIAYENRGPGELLLHNLYVAKNHRLKGVAKTLLHKSVRHGSKPCIVMDRATPELVDLLLKCPYSFKVEISTETNAS